MTTLEMCSRWATYQQYGSEDLLGMRESAETSIGAWIDQGWFPGWWEFNAYMFPPDFKSFARELIERHSGGA